MQLNDYQFVKISKLQRTVRISETKDIVKSENYINGQLLYAAQRVKVRMH